MWQWLFGQRGPPEIDQSPSTPPTWRDLGLVDEAAEALVVRESADGSRRIAIYRGDDLMYRYRIEKRCIEEEQHAVWWQIIPYCKSGVYDSPERAIQEATLDTDFRFAP